MDALREQLLAEFEHLTPDQQAHLLGVARVLRQSHLPPATPGEVLLAAQDRFTFAPGEVEAMMQAIEEGCENIDPEGWQGMSGEGVITPKQL